MTDWPFDNGNNFSGLRLLRFLDWAHESVKPAGMPVSTRPFFALPPMQRSAVWRPKQAIDLWDSLMRGLPIGTFYLLRQSGHKPENMVSLDGTVSPRKQPGYDLLDGQQRLRALLLGVFNFSQEKRCLWVDLGALESARRPIVRMTSQAQPFGYDVAKGNKISLEERKKARKEIEVENNNYISMVVKCDRGEPLTAYDRDLFDKTITRDGKQLFPPPPRPYSSTPQTYLLHELFSLWRKSFPRCEEDTCCEKAGVAALRSITGDAPALESSLRVLHKAFDKIAKAEVGVLRVDLQGYDHEDVLELFERIGAGGTPLSGEERLYSIYKFHEPFIRKAVDDIHIDVGKVLFPTSIAATALRIANAQASEGSNDTPEIKMFAKAMADTTENTFKAHLHRLIAESSGPKSKDGALLRGFQTVKQLLEHREDAGHFWIPSVLLVSLPTELWQVLVFWAIRNPGQERSRHSRMEAVRFALFWNLSVANKNRERAARIAFRLIKAIGDAATFPGAKLYETFVDASRQESCADPLISAEEYERRFCKSDTVEWKSDRERFAEGEARDNIGKYWWESGKRMLPWLQREYINKSFPTYDPLSDHEDDLPYDLDHICPRSDWGGDWRKLDRRLAVDESLKKKIDAARWHIGDGIGNQRLIDSPQNRQDQNIDVSDKMPFILRDYSGTADGETEAVKWAFPTEHFKVWTTVSPKKGVKLEDRIWTKDRLKAFQKAVEMRAAWLYRQFYQELEYKSWICAVNKGE